MKTTLVAIGVVALTTVSLAQVTVYSNNVGGDNYSDPGTVNPGAGYLINSYVGPNTEVWAYNELKDNAQIGIDTAQPLSGNGSLHLKALGNPNSKASIGLGRLDGGALGSFDALTHWNADIRTESSAATNASMILRLYIGNGTNATNGSRQGFLVFDTLWSTVHPQPTINYGTWQNMDFIANASTLYVRPTNTLITALFPQLDSSQELTFASAMSTLAGQGYQVWGANAGWGTSGTAYEGFMDNYTLGFGGNATTYNFEAVPEPATMTILAAGAAFLARRRKNRS